MGAFENHRRRLLMSTGGGEGNYTMLYYLGDECEDVTGGWSAAAIAPDRFTGNYYTLAPNVTKNNNHMLIERPTSGSDIRHSLGSLLVNNGINLTDYSRYGMYWYANLTSGSYAGWIRMLEFYTNRTETTKPSTGNVYAGDSPLIHTSGDGTTAWGYANIESLSGNYYFGLTASYYSAVMAKVYCAALFKPDDWATLCGLAGVSAPGSLIALVEDTEAMTAIFDNPKAASFAAKDCTGDFMASCLADANALSIINASECRRIIYANKHWRKFLTVADRAAQEV